MNNALAKPTHAEAMDRFILPAKLPLLSSVAGCGVVSTQITVMKVLAGHPEGRASIADLTRYVAVLMSSGTDWSQRMKILAGRAPNLDIFTSGYVLREVGSWSITDLGRTFLTSIEAPVVEPVAEPLSVPANVAAIDDLDANVIKLDDHKVALRRRRAAAA